MARERLHEQAGDKIREAHNTDSRRRREKGCHDTDAPQPPTPRLEGRRQRGASPVMGHCSSLLLDGPVYSQRVMSLLRSIETC